MISGVDIVFSNPGLPRGNLLDAVIRIVQRSWKDVVIQDANDGTTYASLWDIPFGLVRELFLYRDRAALESWSQSGADPVNASSMLHLIESEDDFTVVVDDPDDATTRTVLDEIKQLSWPGNWVKAA